MRIFTVDPYKSDMLNDSGVDGNDNFQAFSWLFQIPTCW